MTLTPGRRFGSYEILAAIGQGGMGEVYRAKDTKLGRDVAIKVLPRAFEQDPERLARFEREARVLASLNHPNIAAIYGFERGFEHDGQECLCYLVLEYVPGETLKGPLPVEDVLAVARQITAALEEAHEKGFVHRDLKPANIKITPEGKVKVLDFGLAKAYADEAASSDPGASPTLSALPTRAGVILGTAGYMSPEQVRGGPVDKRADIWAFGCVVYELLAGKKAFASESAPDAMVAVLSREPDWEALPAAVPVRLRELLRRCLRKDPRERLHDIADARLEMEGWGGSPEPLPGGAHWARPPQRHWLPWGIAAVMTVVGAAALAVASRRLESSEAKPVTRTVIALPPGERLAVDLYPALALSPDGRRLVYVTTRSSRTQIHLRPLDRFEATPIPGTEGAVGPFFSPDGEQIGFLAGGKLKKLALSGGSPTALLDVGDFRGASWGADGRIVLTPTADSAARLTQVAASGGAARLLMAPDASRVQRGERWPDILPGGEAAVFSEWTTGSPDDFPIGLVNLDSGERRALLTGGAGPRYASPGFLLYARGGVLLAAPFDLARLRVSGEPIPIASRVMTDSQTAAAQFSVAGETLAYVPGTERVPERSVVLVDRKGQARPLLAARHAYTHPRFSPDGRRLAVGISQVGNRSVWIYDLTRETLTRFTFGGGTNAAALWSPDGKRVLFSSDRGGARNLYWAPAAGGGPEERLTSSSKTQSMGSWSPDGKWVLYEEVDAGGSPDIWALPVAEGGAGERKPRPVLQGPFAERHPRFSPDGRWIAYSSNETGRYEVFVQAFEAAGGGKRQISTEGGTEPIWSRDGKELFYRNGDRMMAVDISTKPSFSHGTPRLLFEGQYTVGPLSIASYDVTPDGRHFVMLQSSDSSPGATQIHVVQNWQAGLKR